MFEDRGPWVHPAITKIRYGRTGEVKGVALTVHNHLDHIGVRELALFIYLPHEG